MIKKEHGSIGQQLLLRGLAAAIIILVVLVLFSVVYVMQMAGGDPLLAKLSSSGKLSFWESSAPKLGVEQVLNLYDGYVSKTLVLYTTIIGVLMGTLLILLGTLIYQMYLRSLDLKKIDLWRESGFLCERLEFLPANRIKLNNLELELNKTQIENLKKLAHHRIIGKPLHSVDMGDHAVQSIKRLREELGAKFIEKSLVKVRTKEGYWLEVDAGGIYGLPPLAEDKS